MNYRILVVTIVGLLMVGGVFILLAQNSTVRAGRPAPTPAPTITEGPPPIVDSSSPLLKHPLSQEDAVIKAFKYDQRIARWENSWSLESLRSEPERISIEWHKDRSYDGSEVGEGVANGPIWVVTIKGPVRLPSWDPTNRVHDGMSYQVSQGTGEIWRFLSGPTISK